MATICGGSQPSGKMGVRMDDAYQFRIRNMSMLCAMLVILIHTPIPCADKWSPGWLIANAIGGGGFARIAVPFFFVVSGYHLAKHMGENGWQKREIIKRIRTLVVPYFLWCIICVVATLPLSVMADFIAGRQLGASIVLFNDWAMALGIKPTSSPANYPLWYLRCLFLYVVTSGLINRAIRKHCHTILGITFVASIGAGLLERINPEIGYFFTRTYSMEYLFYFILGICMYRGIVNVKYSSRAILMGVSVVVGGGGLVAKLFLDANSSLAALSPCVKNLIMPFLLYATWMVIPRHKFPNWAYCSFQIYVMHLIVLTYAVAILKMIIHNEFALAGLAYVITVIASFGMSVLLKKGLPRVNALLCASR